MPDVHEGAVPLPPASVDFNALNDALAAGVEPDKARAAAVVETTVALSSDEAAARAAESAAEAPSLAGLNKTDLLAIADAERVTEALDKDGNLVPVADATNDRIREAIEAKRGGEILPRRLAEGETLPSGAD